MAKRERNLRPLLSARSGAGSAGAGVEGGWGGGMEGGGGVAGMLPGKLVQLMP